MEGELVKGRVKEVLSEAKLNKDENMDRGKSPQKGGDQEPAVQS